MDVSLNYDVLLSAIKQIFPVLYYQTDAHINRGRVYKIKERKVTDAIFSIAAHPEYLLLHPDDLPVVKQILKHRTLEPLSAYKE